MNQHLIEEAEIGLAILYANLKEHCNPNKQLTLTEAAAVTKIAEVDLVEEVVEEMPPKKSQKIAFKKPKIEPSACIEPPPPSSIQKVENTTSKKENTQKITDSSIE